MGAQSTSDYSIPNFLNFLIWYNLISDLICPIAARLEYHIRMEEQIFFFRYQIHAAHLAGTHSTTFLQMLCILHVHRGCYSNSSLLPVLLLPWSWAFFPASPSSQHRRLISLLPVQLHLHLRWSSASYLRCHLRWPVVVDPPASRWLDLRWSSGCGRW